MKKILIVIEAISSGGAERGLMALLNALDYNKYEVDLLYFYHEEEYYKDVIPKEVNVILPDIRSELALSSKRFVLKNIRRIKYWNIIFRRIYYGVKEKVTKNYYRQRYTSWKGLKKYIPMQAKEYDVCIGFCEGFPVYYAIDKVVARKYIAFQRTDYKLMGVDADKDIEYFDKVDNICVLSDEMKNNFEDVFPKFKDKVVVLPNVINVNEIIDKSNESVDFDIEYTGTRIISVGTLRKVKGYDIAIKACKKLVDKGYDFKWYVLGYGEEENNLKRQIEQLKLKDRFILLGNKRNPYAYMKKCDIFVQCSYREGFSTSVFEAKTLRLPIVITDAPGMKNQIENNINGLVVSCGNEEEVANGIEKLLCNKDIRDKFTLKLNEHVLECKNDTQEKLNLFDRIIR